MAEDNTECEEIIEDDETSSLLAEAGFVLPYLYFGPQDVTLDEASLRHLGITHVFSIIGEPDVRFKGITYCSVDHVRDRSEQFILNQVMSCDEFINQARKRGGKVFVNCRAGISRSSALVIGHLILTYGFTFEDALDLVRSDRPEADPNEGFRQQLDFLDMMRRRYEGPNQIIKMKGYKRSRIDN